MERLFLDHMSFIACSEYFNSEIKLWQGYSPIP